MGQLYKKFLELVYWRDLKKSGLVFGSGFIILLSMAYFSLISVVAYTSLVALTLFLSFRVYKSILQAVQKTNDGHPLKEYLDAEVEAPSDKVHDAVDVALIRFNKTATELRRLFLVEDLFDSIKFGVLLWCLTYVGAWFNGMTLLILGFVGLFTLPKVYETNQAQIDQYLDLVKTKVSEVTTKVKAVIPYGKKDKEQ